LIRYIKVILISVLSLFMIAGCGESNKVAGRSRIDGSRARADTAAMSGDNEFDLLDEEIEEQMIEVSDPLEGINRFMFGFNDMVYSAVLIPAAEFYKDILPEPTRINVGNFFENITMPARYVNCLLQGNGEGADIELRRFWINTTEGFLGLGDPALEKYGLEPVDEDLGQTLAVWGVGDGFYIVLPILGPSTLRDTAGNFGDMFLNPVWYVDPCGVRIGVSALKFTNNASFHTEEYRVMFRDEMDPYIAMRQSYLQYRAKKINE